VAAIELRRAADSSIGEGLSVGLLFIAVGV
jgi:hypothetical protein